MKGLELSEKYYEEFGKAMISEKFPELEARAATGLAGEGSECFGFDDSISQDHDFEPSFCIWLTDEDYDKYYFELSKAYNSLPAEFMGFEKCRNSPTGGARRGVLKTSDFYRRFLGSQDAPHSFRHWLSLPEYALCSAVSGKVFRDDLGEFSKIRNELLKGYPEDVRLKKIAAAMIVASQSGNYNFPRCLAHGENGAAQLAVYTFVKNIIALVYLLNNRYMPFYKWVYKGMRHLDILSELESSLTFLSECENSKNTNAKNDIIAGIAKKVLNAAAEQGLVSENCRSMEIASYEINSKIKDNELRNESIFLGMIKE